MQNTNRLGLNFILDTKNDTKPPINPYNICCTYKNVRTTLLEVKKVKGGSRGSGKGDLGGPGGPGVPGGPGGQGGPRGQGGQDDQPR